MTDAPERPENGQLDTPEEIARETMVAVTAPFATPEKLERARELVRTLAVSYTNAGLYPTTHPLVMQSLSDLVSAVQALAGFGFESVAINIYKDTLFVENQVFPEESVTYRKLVVELLGHGISAVTLHAGLTAADAEALVALISDAEITDIDAARAFLTGRGVTAVEVDETSVLESGEEERGERVKKSAKDTYDAGVTSMREVESQAKLGKVFEVEPLQRVVNSLLDNIFQDPAAVLGLTAIKGHDDYTLNHSINVCILAISLGASLGLDAEQMRSLGLAGLLYDLGKVRVPEEILAKPGPLTAEEWELMKKHAEEGADLLKRIQLLDPMPMIVAFEHHQRHDAMGYPEPQGGQEQHLFSRIVAVCDAYDAMTTHRPFRREIRPDKAVAVLMQGRAKAYDPGVTKALVAMLGIYPMGACARLDDGSLAVVYRVNNDDLLHPRVKVLADRDGRWLETPETLDLRVVDPTTGQFARSIADCIPAAEAGVDDVWQYL
ncbi:MAG: HD-GYP domain-containing protein [Coriobacteriales bacterium]|nr:HD-GYP domain-containing protein [Coriobacteriales bacterium]